MILPINNYQFFLKSSLVAWNNRSGSFFFFSHITFLFLLRTPSTHPHSYLTKCSPQQGIFPCSVLVLQCIYYSHQTVSATEICETDNGRNIFHTQEQQKIQSLKQHLQANEESFLSIKNSLKFYNILFLLKIALIKLGTGVLLS